MMKQRADELGRLTEKHRTSPLMKVALVFVAVVAITSTALAALYIPYISVQPVCAEARGRWVTYEGDMSYSFVQPYARYLRSFGMRIRYDRNTYKIWVAPVDYNEGLFQSGTMNAAEVILYGTIGGGFISNRGSRPRLTCGKVKRLAIVTPEDRIRRARLPRP